MKPATRCCGLVHEARHPMPPLRGWAYAAIIFTAKAPLTEDFRSQRARTGSFGPLRTSPCYTRMKSEETGSKDGIGVRDVAGEMVLHRQPGKSKPAPLKSKGCGTRRAAEIIDAWHKSGLVSRSQSPGHFPARQRGSAGRNRHGKSADSRGTLAYVYHSDRAELDASLPSRARLFRGNMAIKPKLTLLFLAFCLLSVGCGGGSTASGSSTQQATPPTNVAGNWQITTRSSVFGLTVLGSGSIAQSGSNLSGQFTLSGTPCSTSATMTGTISAAVLTIQLSENGQTVTLSGTASADGNSASGSYTAPAGGCTNGDSGTWTGSRLAAPGTNVTDNWQASFASSVSAFRGAMYGYIAQSGNFTTANLHIDGSPCFGIAGSAGTISGFSVLFTATASGQTATFTGTLSADGNSMQGTYAVSGGCASGDSGTWTAARIRSGQCVPAPAELLASWKGEGTALDVMGANPGTALGGTTYSPGIVGQAFSFDGSTGFVNVPDSASLRSVQTVESVEFWIDPVVPPSVPEYVYARRQPLTSETFSIFVMPDGSLGVLVGTSSSPTAGGSKFQSTSGVVTFGQYQHVVATVSTVTGMAAIYVNGGQIPLVAVSGPSTLSGVLNGANQIYLGRREDLSAGEGVSGAGYLKGAMDEVTLYAAELDEAQAQFLFHAGSGGKCPVTETVTLSGLPVLDQSFTTSSSGLVSAYINEGVTYVAQTFTASLTGYLTGVNIDVDSQPTGSPQTSPFPIQVSILATTSGIPTSTVLASAIVGPGNVGLGSLASFEQAPAVTAGTQYAIAVSYVGAPPPGAGKGQGFWVGANGGGYAAGSMFSSSDASHWSALSAGDLFFRTYVAQ